MRRRSSPDPRHEQAKLIGKVGTLRQRLGEESQRRFDQCNLCLQRLSDPVGEQLTTHFAQMQASLSFPFQRLRVGTCFAELAFSKASCPRSRHSMHSAQPIMQSRQSLQQRLLLPRRHQTSRPLCVLSNVKLASELGHLTSSDYPVAAVADPRRSPPPWST